MLALAACSAPAPPPDIRLLPRPATLVPAAGALTLPAGSVIAVPPGDAAARAAADWMAELMQRTHGLSLTVRDGNAGAIVLTRQGPPAAEHYTVSVTPGGAVIAAGNDGGFRHGATTLWQLARRSGTVTVPSVSITDGPRFAWRGLMLDSARHYQSPAFIKTLLDAMAANKLNTFHWHLVDDQAWRIEIRKYPRLTEVGGWRAPATAPGAPPLPRVGGIYTQAEVRDIVAHAAKRGITVVPEIEMPGHALSAIRAYPRLGTGAPVPTGVESHWGVFPWLYNVEDDTFTFLEDVLTEVMALFPSRYIHIGGDEAVKDQWRASPRVQARMRTLGIRDEAGLQSWFVKRIERFLSAHGRKLIGWDEILEGGIAPEATVMSWRGIDGAREAARSGHDAVLSPSPTLYLNHLQGDGGSEGPGRSDPMTLEGVYMFDPVPPGLDPTAHHHILGVQGNLWTEYVRDEARAAYMLFPRASAVAEVGWSAAPERDFPGFVRRLIPQTERMAALGIAGAPSVFAPLPRERFDPSTARVTASFTNQAGLPMRYTLDGTAPDAASPPVEGPLDLGLPSRLRVASFDGDTALAGEVERLYNSATVRRRTDRELTPCTRKVVLSLPDDAPAQGSRPTFQIDILNPCWLYEAAPLSGATAIAIDVGQVPFNFQVGKDRDAIRFRPPATPAGEFEVRAGGCEGVRIAVLPLAPAAANPGITRLQAPLTGARTATADLCITYTARGPDPLWAVSAVQLIAP